MTEREKMIEAINSVQAYGIMSNAFGGDLPVTNEMLADALIAAGIGDVTEWKERAKKHRVRVLPGGTIKQLYSAEEVEDINRQREEYKHCAEVAERALLTACVNLIKDKEDNVNMELLARVVYTKALRKAKKEVEEENNAEN